MRILVIGSGAREHALTWKLAQSQRVTKLYAAPGNPGMASIAECVPIAVTHLPQLADFAERSQIDLTVVGPEIPLVAGIADVDFVRHRIDADAVGSSAGCERGGGIIGAVDGGNHDCRLQPKSDGRVCNSALSEVRRMDRDGRDVFRGCGRTSDLEIGLHS